MRRSEEPKALSRAATLAALPPTWPTSLLPAIRTQLQSAKQTLVVLDDDPTGTQTVADIPVLTGWSIPALEAMLRRDLPAFYILTNSRSLPEAEAVALTRTLGRNLLAASRTCDRDVAIVSRGDSTLRGHFPAEMDALADVWPDAFAGCLLIPAFFAGGRLTLNDIHYVAEGDALLPAGATPFARDAVFGYRSSNLRDWVAEKSQGRIPAATVASISLSDLRRGGADAVQAQLETIRGGQMVVVNAVTRRDLEVFVLGLLRAEAAGRRFLYRTAASFVPVRAGLTPRPLLTAADLNLGGGTGGLIVAGSYVPKTTRQIEALLSQTDIDAVEVSVAALLDAAHRPGEVARVRAATAAALQAEKNVLVYTSRRLVTDHAGRSGLAIGRIISDSLVAIMRGLPVRPRFLIAKGGITASDIATAALGVRQATILGQILPGIPVWQLGPESRFPGLPYVVFPGNVGDENALVETLRLL